MIESVPSPTDVRTIRPAPDRAFIAARMRARADAGRVYFAAGAEAITRCAADMADRFFAGATLLAFGAGAHATDAQHNSVEFVHPVLPGCRALPAIALSTDVATVGALGDGREPDGVYAHQLRILGRRGDIALAFASPPGHPAIIRGLETATALGMQTIALVGGTIGADGLQADHVFAAPGDDPLIAQELHLATYHILWELTHIMLNHRGIAQPSQT